MKKPRFLLINPWIHDFAAFDLWIRPLGFLYLYSFLRKAECPLSYIDLLQVTEKEAEQHGIDLPRSRPSGRGKFYSEHIDKPDVYARIPRHYRRFGKPLHLFENLLESASPADAILVTSSMTYWYGGVQETIRMCRKMLPGIPVILGGTYATLCTAHAQACSGADYVIAGPWETCLLPLLQDTFGIMFTNNDPDFSSLSPPANDLYPGSPFSVMRFTRGCPFACEYCASGILSPLFETRSPQSILSEIEWNAGLGRTDIVLYDDALLVNADRTLAPVLEQVITNRYGLRFHTPNGLHARFMDNTIARLFRLAHFSTVRLSFESVEGRVREASDGKAEPADLEQAVSALNRAGYGHGEIEVYMLMGVPGQTDRSVFDTAEFIHSLGCIIRPAQYSPVPRTVMFESGISPESRIAQEPLLQNSTIAPGWDFDTARYDRIKQLVKKMNSRLKTV